MSIVIPVWNGQDTISLALKSVLNQSYDSDSIRIIVVDNGSTDNTLEIVQRFPGITLLEEPKAGSYAARNTGINVSDSKYLAFMDADCIADVAWVESGVSLLESNNMIGVVAGHIEVTPSRNGSRLAYLIERELAFRQSETAKRGTAVTANWISPSAAIKEAGGFDESLKSGGDWLLSSRLSKNGYQVVYEPTAIVRHPSRSGLLDLLKKRRRVAGGVWARRKVGLLRLIRSELVGGAQRVANIARSRALSSLEKAAIFPIIIIMTVVSVCELARLSLGGSARRS